jgi:hypothetical protein
MISEYGLMRIFQKVRNVRIAFNFVHILKRHMDLMELVGKD